MAINVFKKFTEGLQKTKEDFSSKLEAVFSSFGRVDADLFDELEDILISSDMGVDATIEIIEYLKKIAKAEKIKDSSEIKQKLKEHIKSILNFEDAITDEEIASSSIILIVGVNGVGKTTTIGKLAYRYKSMGKKVIVAAGDTFRAAAVEQLQIWCQKSGVDIIANKEGSDPAAVIFDAVQAAKARNADCLICDTAGRLHNKKNLMNELNKIFRVVEKEYEKNQIKVYLVIDATTGQNGIIQAKAFNEAIHIDGIILTKLDGTAKGGIVIPVQKELNVPIKYVGLGEKIDDLQSFDSEKFVDAIFD